MIDYKEGEKVLCYDGPLIYEGKCLERRVKNNHLKYYIHYIGWHLRHDRWVGKNSLLKYNEANLQKQKDLQLAYSVQPSKTKKPTAKKRNSKALSLTQKSSTSIKKESTVKAAAANKIRNLNVAAKSVRQEKKPKASKAPKAKGKETETLTLVKISKTQSKDTQASSCSGQRDKKSGRLNFAMK